MTSTLLVQLRMVCQFYNTVDVLILPPYMPTEREKTDVRLFANNVRRLFAEELRLPLVEQVWPKFHFAAEVSEPSRLPCRQQWPVLCADGAALCSLKQGWRQRLPGWSACDGTARCPGLRGFCRSHQGCLNVVENAEGLSVKTKYCSGDEWSTRD